MKTVPSFSPEWLAGLYARASVQPLSQRIDLMAYGEHVGTVIPEILDEFRIKSPSNINSLLYKEKRLAAGGYVFHWQIDGDLSQMLNQIALFLRDAPLKQGSSEMARHVGRHVAHHWRNEQLAVNSAQGIQLGTVERGAVRALGIATRAVHLVGRSTDGRYWVQQRALDKSNDPGKWDTLMGGMVSAQDSVETALVRETWEEAGLHLDAMQEVRYGGAITVQRPTGEDGIGGIGYMAETTDWYCCTVPAGLVPVNQDGEVAQFELLDVASLVARLENNEFTLEAALILVAVLEIV